MEAKENTAVLLVRHLLISIQSLEKDIGHKIVHVLAESLIMCESIENYKKKYSFKLFIIFPVN